MKISLNCTDQLIVACLRKVNTSADNGVAREGEKQRSALLVAKFYRL